MRFTKKKKKEKHYFDRVEIPRNNGLWEKRPQLLRLILRLGTIHRSLFAYQIPVPVLPTNYAPLFNSSSFPPLLVESGAINQSPSRDSVSCRQLCLPPCLESRMSSLLDRCSPCLSWPPLRRLPSCSHVIVFSHVYFPHFEIYQLFRVSFLNWEGYFCSQGSVE